jgi:hypothetical protein
MQLREREMLAAACLVIKGYVHSFEFDQRTNKLQKKTYTTVCKGKAITSLQYKAWFSSNKAPELLANCQDNTLRLFRYRAACISLRCVLGVLY